METDAARQTDRNRTRQRHMQAGRERQREQERKEREIETETARETETRQDRDRQRQTEAVRQESLATGNKIMLGKVNERETMQPGKDRQLDSRLFTVTHGSVFPRKSRWRRWVNASLICP